MSGWDYAQIETRSQEAPPKSPRLKAMLLVVASLALVSGAFAGGFWLGHEQGRQTATGEDHARLEKQLKRQQEEMNRLRQDASKRAGSESAANRLGELTFYNELPRQSVSPAPMQPEKKGHVPPPAAKPPVRQKESMQQLLARELQQQSSVKGQQTTEDKAAPAESYLLQVGSFQRRQDAEKFSARFAGHGMKPVIRVAELKERGTWYRVYLGPYADKAHAEGVRTRVRNELKITGLIVRGG